MKKLIISALAAAALLFGFASCSGDLHDSEQLQMTGIIGDMDGSGTAKMTTIDGNVSTYKFTYNSSWNAWGGGSGKMNFKPLKVWDNWATPGWGPDTATDVTVNGDAVAGKQGGGQANFVAVGLVNGKEYTLTFTTSGNDVSVALTGYVKPDPIEADLSAINATTMAQPNAYIEIKGDNIDNALVGKYFFNKSGDNYVANIPFDTTGKTFANWGQIGDYYVGWGKIGVGDNDNVVAADKQFNYVSDGELNLADNPNNLGLTEIISNKKGLITVTASSDGCKVTVTTF